MEYLGKFNDAKEIIVRVKHSYLNVLAQVTYNSPIDSFVADDRVLIIDDLLATGGTAKASCELVEKLGATVEACAFVIELDDLKGREKLKGYEVHSLLHY